MPAAVVGTQKGDGGKGGHTSDLSNSSVHDFIVQLESSAKRVLKAANKKAREAHIAEQARAVVEGRRAEKQLKAEKNDGKTLSKTGTVLMKALTMSSSMLDTIDPLETLGKMPPGTETLQMRYSVPSMSISMVAETVNILDGDAARPSSMGASTAQLSPIRRKFGASTTGGLDKQAAAAETVVAPRRNLILEKLSTSPFISQGTGTLDEILVERKTALQNLRDERNSEKAALATKEGTWALKAQVADVMSGKQSNVGTLHKSLMKKQKVKHINNNRATELQGPIDWSCNGLKIKYRGENEREAVWSAWQSANAFSGEALDKGVVLSLCKVERHPLFVQFYKHIRAENAQSVARTKTRLLMKRFVFDVHEVWLTNLQHLREHQPSRLLSENPNSGNDSHDHDEGKGGGLINRRDVKAIESMEAQIQSVSQKRVLERAYYTTRMPEPKVVLDYAPGPTPTLMPPRPLPPLLENLVESLRVSVPSTPSGTMYLFIDRLLPPADHKQPKAGQVHGSVLWRLTTYQHENCISRSVVLTEEAVKAQGDFISERYKSSEGPGTMEIVHVTKLGQDVLLPWSIMDINAEMRVAVGYSGEGPGRPATVRIELRAALKADYEGDVLSLPVAPTLIQALLGKQGIPLDSVVYWSSAERATDTWPQLFALLHIVEGHSNEYGDPEPKEVALTAEKTEADRVTGALSTAAALAYAHEIASSVRIDESTLLLRLAGLKGSFVSPEEPEEAESLSEAPAPGLDQSTTAVANDPKARHDDDDNNDAAAAPTSPSPPPLPRSALNPALLVLEQQRAEELREHNQLLRRGMWEDALDLRAPSLSMVCRGGLAYVAQVPGAMEHGRMGLWFPHKMPREYTQAMVVMFRDARLSTTDTVLVNITLALDTSIIFPTVLAWEDFSTNPPKCPAEEVEPYIPMLLSPPGVLLRELLISPIDARVSETAAIFASLPTEGLDHIPLDFPSKPQGMMRQWPFHNEYSFRRKVVNTLLGVDPVLPTIVFGITKYGAQPNTTGVNTRNIWHSTLAITEHINRPRAPKDYHYVLANIKSRGANDPAAFACRMRSGECVGLSSTAFNNFEKEYADIKLRREIFARQLALDAKIESSQMVMKTREKALKAEMQRELQRAIEKKLRKATKSEKGWCKRFNMSTLLECQGNWERRRDDRAGTIFFRKILAKSANSHKEQPGERFMQTCQWEVPPTWDGDPLSVPDDEYGPEEGFDDGNNDTNSLKSGSLNGGASSVTGGPFEQPPETWHPAIDAANAADEKSLDTPGIRPALQNRRMGAGGGGGGGGSSVKTGRDSTNDTVLAERSYGGSDANTIDTANLEHIAEQLVSSDELMRVIARRLGLPVESVVPAEELNSLFSVSNATSGAGKGAARGGGTAAGKSRLPGISEGLNAPRDNFVDTMHEPEFDSDDDLWSDDEQEAGDYDEEDVGDLPQDHREVNELRKKKMREDKGSNVSVPDSIPFLNLKGAGIVPHDDTSALGAGWRRLPRPEVPQKFFYKCTQTKTIGPDKDACNTSNVPIFLTPISPVDACAYTPQNFSSDVESIFVPDCRKDMERAISTLERNIKREEDLAQNVPTDDLILFGTAQETTAADNYVAKQFKEDQAAFVDPKEKASRKALLAAKSNNIAQMEDALEEEVPINTADAFGNTLLILASQQGSKRMCKFLLRRGANINSQALSGNTALHYCYAYNFPDLGQYLKGKGADDSILNVDGMTCYEGLNHEALRNPGDSSSGEDDENDD